MKYHNTMILKTVYLLLGYISNIYSYPIIDTNKIACTNCFMVSVTCDPHILNIRKFNKSLYYCDICNIHNLQDKEVAKLYCNFCEEIMSCHIDTGCFNCMNCSQIIVKDI